MVAVEQVPLLTIPNSYSDAIRIGVSSEDQVAGICFGQFHTKGKSVLLFWIWQW